MPRVVHFEIHAHAPRRLLRFYVELFGWEFTAWDGSEDYWHIRTGDDAEPGINGGLTRRQWPGDGAGVASWVGTVEVDSVERFGRRLEEAGGAVVTPRFVIAGTGYMLHARDPEGNLFSLIEKDLAAAP